MTLWTLSRELAVCELGFQAGHEIPEALGILLAQAMAILPMHSDIFTSHSIFIYEFEEVTLCGSIKSGSTNKAEQHSTEGQRAAHA